MALVFEEIHATPDKKRVNEEWFLLINQGAAPINARGLNVIVAARGRRGSVLGQIDPGFVLQPGERIIIVTGLPGKKAHGEPPTREGVRVYHLLQREPLLKGDGTTLKFSLNQLEVAKVVYDKAAASGVAAPEQPA